MGLARLFKSFKAFLAFRLSAFVFNLGLVFALVLLLGLGCWSSLDLSVYSLLLYCLGYIYICLFCLRSLVVWACCRHE